MALVLKGRRNEQESIYCIIIIKYKAVDWDMTLIEEEQDAIHEHYKEKTKKLGIDST